ncbi:putative plasma membrane g protein coupled receptor [Erysiphe necator]|uniref:Putative plasma membrane g protein coupled receptor n=1 Tax=Uncinula necator TaxID=52586 RepID=A0A0B1PDL3_UNCNE|nr:putative plasma membrane g protein coupled receptor [Erysiphe necator]
MASSSLGPITTEVPTTAFERTLEIYLNDASTTTSTLVKSSTDEYRILIFLSFFFASISVISSALAFYWFIKMRRSFRHDLIMLLIQSDMFKALWFMSYPLVFLVSGPVRSESAFCQISGFFLTVGIEQSDIAVLIIAVHSALHIFKNKPFGKEEGLYPYRHTAYTIWCLFPLGMASLAFLGGPHAYVVSEAHCYLPSRPLWYKQTLSWVPRYFIFIIILGTYCSIYYYVRNKFHSFTKDDMEIPRSYLPYSRSRAPTPPLCSNGLTLESSITSRDENEETSSITKNFTQKGSKSHAAHFMMTASFARISDSNIPPVRSPIRSSVGRLSIRNSISIYPLPNNLRSALLSPHHTFAISETSADPPEATSPWFEMCIRRYSTPASNQSIPSPNTENVNITSMIPVTSKIPTTVSVAQIQQSLSHITGRAEMMARRDQIQRQLRFLFIYPLIYMGMWLMPFVSNVIQFDDKYALNPPFPLSCITTVSIGIQAFVDCWLFVSREKPWRHIPGNNGSFWASLKFWTDWSGLAVVNGYNSGPGRTRDEMVREARAAYQRRDDELASRRNQLDESGGKYEYPNPQRCWWDAERSGDFDIISSVEEEK